MTRAFSGAISGDGSGPDTIALNAANRIIENIVASGDTNKRLVETLEKLINLRDVVKKRQQRNGNSCSARDTKYCLNAPLCCIGLSGGGNFLLSDSYGNCVPICDSYTCEEDADDVQRFAALSGRCPGLIGVGAC
ncbi:hypothetical protein DPMN_028799 [Dreissena polymorpha]|uniref:Uncharacterized protein n=1 Tax=Dreissena polymorpha TaxID=45954 RepID=A0A9D4REN9_DREPO|nr:hypothetical protein DPMN_028799 [Dreissena polymorpha]